MTLLRLALLAGSVVAAASCAPYHGSSDYGVRPAPPPYDYPRYAPRSADPNWAVTRNAGETDYELPENVLFGLDSARILPQAAAELTEIAEAARDQPRAQIFVEGHTDTSGTSEHNRELSENRARAVADLLIRQGVDPRRVRSEGLGKRGLAIQTPDGVREPRNRRVVIRFIDAPHSAPQYYPRRERDN